MLTDKQIEAGLAAVMEKVHKAVRNEIGNSRPGELAEGLAMQMAMASLDVETFRKGARI